MLFIVQGPPAIGKSTLITNMKDDFPADYFIDFDQLRSFLGKPDWNNHGEDYYLALDLAAKLINEMHNQGKHIFFLDSISENALKYLLRQLSPIETRQIVLWANASVLQERISTREDHVFSDLAITLDRNAYFEEYAQKVMKEKKGTGYDVSTFSKEALKELIANYIHSCL